MGRANGENHIGFSQIVVEIWLKPCRSISFYPSHKWDGNWKKYILSIY